MPAGVEDVVDHRHGTGEQRPKSLVDGAFHLLQTLQDRALALRADLLMGLLIGVNLLRQIQGLSRCSKHQMTDFYGSIAT